MKFFDGFSKMAFDWKKLFRGVSEKIDLSRIRQPSLAEERRAVRLGLKKYIDVGSPPTVGKSGKIVDFSAYKKTPK